MKKVVAVTVAVIVLGGCGGKEARTCEPGRQVACACPGGTSGAQACMANGRGYEACQCGPSTPSSAAGKAASSTAPAPAPSPAPAPAAGEAPAAPEGKHRRTAADLVPCPDDAIALAARLTPRPATDVGEPLAKESATCTAGLFPDPGWAVVFRRGMAHERVVIDAATRTVIARAATEQLAGGDGVEVVRLATVDFDGDGASEILHDVNYDARGYIDEELIAYKVRGDTLDKIFQTSLALNNSGAAMEDSEIESYAAQYKLMKEGDGTYGLEVTGAVVQGHPDVRDAVIGKAHFRWSGDRLARK